MSVSEHADLQIKLSLGDADPVAVDEATSRLRKELLMLDVDGVKRHPPARRRRGRAEPS